MKAPKLIFCILCALCMETQAQDEVQKGIALFYRRAEGSVGLSPKAEIIEEAITILEKELGAQHQTELAGQYYLQSLNFKARFVCTKKSDKENVLNTAIKIGKILKDKYPKNGPICFEYIVSVGLLGEISGVIKSVNDGVVNKMRTNSEKLITIDSMYNSGAGWKVLGVLNYRVPNLGIIMNWPSVKNAKKILEKALLHFPNDMANNFFYAEALRENGEDTLARLYYEQILKLEMRKDYVLEDLDFKTKAILILQKMN